MKGSGISLCGLCSWVKKKESAQPSEREGADWQDVPVAGNRSPGAGLLVIAGGPSRRRHMSIHKFKGLISEKQLKSRAAFGLRNSNITCNMQMRFQFSVGVLINCCFL